ncbi:MAG: hypothetical protein DIU78_016155 [Pseudomonadota bacterium]|nr:MAG: hypothetical protein DIU78_04120 [Pseudomonadota bacterium]
MKTRITPAFREEAERFRLVFTCENCAHFDPESAGCGNGYPTEPHHRVDLVTRSELEFCKTFELA